MAINSITPVSGSTIGPHETFQIQIGHENATEVVLSVSDGETTYNIWTLTGGMQVGFDGIAFTLNNVTDIGQISRANGWFDSDLLFTVTISYPEGPLSFTFNYTISGFGDYPEGTRPYSEEGSTPGGTVSLLDDLGDVNVAGVQDQEALVYDANTNTWVPGTVASGPGGDFPQGKYDAVTKPAQSNDSSQGYEVGSIWVDVAAEQTWVCTDASVGAARWRRATTARGVGTYTFAGTGTPSNGQVTANTATAANITQFTFHADDNTFFPLQVIHDAMDTANTGVLMLRDTHDDWWVTMEVTGVQIAPGGYTYFGSVVDSVGPTLTVNDEADVWFFAEWAGAGGGATSLNELTDVIISNPNAGDFLINAGGGTFINAQIPIPVFLWDLSPISMNQPPTAEEDGYALVWSIGTNSFILAPTGDSDNLPTTEQKAALDAADSGGAGPSGANPFVTLDEVGALGGGTVTSVGITGTDGIEVDSGSPITGAGAIVLGSSKLLGIEAGATADQTGAEIKALYEAEADTNAYTDADAAAVGNLGTASTKDFGTLIGDMVQLQDVEGNPGLPAVDGSLLTNLPGVGDLPVGEIDIPGTFNDTLGSSIFWNGDRVIYEQSPYTAIDFTLTDSVNDYYVNYAEGNNGNTGTSSGPGNSWKTLDYAVANAASPAVIHLEDDWVGYLSSGTTVKVFTGKLKIIGEGSSGKTIIAAMRESYSKAGFSWTPTGASNCYKSSTVQAKRYRAQFFVDTLDSYGFSTPMDVAIDASTCETTPGTFFWSGSELYVHMPDGTEPDPGVNWLYAESPYDFEIHQGGDTSNDIILLENLEFLSNNGTADVAGNPRYRPVTTGAATAARFGCKNCRSYGSSGYGFQVYDADVVVLEDCTAQYTRRDGFNYHSFLVGGTSAEYMTVYEHNCRVHYTGWDWDDQAAAGASNNGTSAHQSMHVLRTNGVYSNTRGAVVADVNGCHSLNYNVRASSPTVDASPRSCFWHEEFLGAGTTSIMYLWGCWSTNESDASIHAISVKAQQDGEAYDGEVRIQHWLGRPDMELDATNPPGQAYGWDGSATTLLEELSHVAGDVTGPNRTTDNAIAVYDGTTGKILKDSGVTIIAGVTSPQIVVTDTSYETEYTPTGITTTSPTFTVAGVDIATLEDGADVTDTANVTAAGALMDSEVNANLKTFVLPATTTISPFARTYLSQNSDITTRVLLGAAADDHTHPTLLSTDEYDAVTGANTPDGTNVFLTENDFGTITNINSRLTDGPLAAFETYANEAALPAGIIENRYAWAEFEGTLWRQNGAGTWEPAGGGAGAEVNDLTAAVTWANIPDANVPETAVTQHEAALSIAAGQIASGTIDTGRISEASVTQHEAAIDHDALANKDSGIATYGQTDDQHRPILYNIGTSKPTAAQAGSGVYHQTTDGSHELEYSDGSTWHGVGGASTFLGLTDVDEPDYTGHAGEFVKVNAGADGLDFGTPAGGGDVSGGSTSVAKELAAYDDTSGKSIGRSTIQAGNTGLTGKTTGTNTSINAAYNSGGATATTSGPGAVFLGTVGTTSGTTTATASGGGSAIIGSFGSFLGTATISNAGIGTLIGGYTGIIGAGDVEISASSAAYGSIAWGSAPNTGETISVTAANAMQLGVGTNAEATSLQVGDIGSGGVRLIGDGAAAASPQNGDIHVASGEVTVRSNGVDNLVKRPPLSVTIESPTSGDVVLLGRFDRSSTIAKVHAVIDSGTSVVVSLDSGASRATSDQQHVNAQTVSSTTSGNDLTKTANLTVDEADWMWVTIGTVTDTVDAICITVSFE